MHIDDIDALEELNENQLWSVAADTSNFSDIRFEALRMWLFDEADPDGATDGRMDELIDRATVMESDEVEEDDIEDLERTGPYFDGAGRLIVEYDGVKYLIEEEDDLDSGFHAV